MTIKQKLANIFNFGSKRKRNVEYLVNHYSAGATDTDENNAEYFARERVGVSAHYFVDDDSATLSVPEENVAYHCGVDYSKGTAPFWKKCTNENSLGIEMCGISKDKDLNITNPTIRNTIKLNKQLMKKHGIDADHVIRHYDVCGKKCPAPLVEHPIYWDAFKLNLVTPCKVKATANINVRSKLGGKFVKVAKKGSKIKIAEVHVYNNELYAKTSKKNWIRLKHTKKI